MIKKVLKEDEELLNKIISNDIFQNVYIYIDTQIYGYNGDNISTFILCNDGKIKAILFQYYDSLQLFQCEEINNQDLNEIVNHIKKYKFSMISGEVKFINTIFKEISDIYEVHTGIVMKKDTGSDKSSGRSVLAQDADYDEIVNLILLDENIGGHYSFEQLKEQFIDRKNNMNCKNIIIKDNNKVICHAATYADSKLISVIGGVITDKAYRGLGLGKIIVNDLTNLIQQENKIPVLYCYDKNTIQWYEKQGFKKINTSSKLELIKNDDKKNNCSKD